MNLKQKTLLVCGMIALVGVFLFPPWKAISQDHEIGPRGGVKMGAVMETPIGYSRLWRPPDQSSRIDMQRIALEVLAVLAFFGVLVTVCKDRKQV
jgi:hypothetical protein